MRLRWIFFASLVGCGARVEAVPTDDAGGDATPAVTDTFVGSTPGGGVIDASGGYETTPVDPEPPSGFVFVAADVCPSSEGVDKIIFQTSEPIGTAAPTSVRVIVGLACEVLGGSGTTDYAFSAKCGDVDEKEPFKVYVEPGFRSVTGAEMMPGIYVFKPTGMPGRYCSDFRP